MQSQVMRMPRTVLRGRKAAILHRPMGILRVAGMRLQPHAREIRPIVSEVQRAAASGEITVSEAGLLAPLEEDNLQLEKRAVAARHAGKKVY
jgi:hypothetical protein